MKGCYYHHYHHCNTTHIIINTYFFDTVPAAFKFLGVNERNIEVCKASIFCCGSGIIFKPNPDEINYNEQAR